MMLVADVLIAVLAVVVACLLLAVSWLVCELSDTRAQLRDTGAELRRLRARTRRMHAAARAKTPASPFAQLTTPWTVPVPELPPAIDVSAHTAEHPIPTIPVPVPADRGPVWPGQSATTALTYGHPRSN